MPAPPSSQGSALAARLRHIWLRRGWAAWALWPLSLLYGGLVRLRRALYESGVLASAHPGCPVLVVGNVIAGGAGKTPVVMALLAHLQAQGWRPGVVARGYGRSADRGSGDCRAVTPASSAAEVGDEPLLLARRCGVPVFVARRRVEAARALRAQHPEVNLIVCDDGLQHLALARDLEICVFNEEGVGNGFLLPAGPLREPWPRPVDAVLFVGTPPPAIAPGTAPAFALQRRLARCALRADGSTVPLASLRGQALHAVAAIARPERFFAMLRAQGLTLARTEALPDHYDYESWQCTPDNGYTLICTEKDAVKLWPRYPEALAVPLELDLPPAFFALLDARLAPSPRVREGAQSAPQSPPPSHP